MRLLYGLAVVLLAAPAALTQGTCSDGTTGVRLSISRTEVRGDSLRVCLAVQGDAAETVGLVSYQMFYNTAALVLRMSGGPVPGSPYEQAGHGHLVRLAVEAGRALGDSAAALGRLSAFAAATAADDAEGQDALASALALVVVAFPDALEGGAAARGAGVEASAALAAKVEAGAAVALDVYPNPSSEASTIRLTGGADGASAAVVLYDALGRRVLVVHDGPVPAGGLALALDTGALPSGVYVVHARVTAAGADAQTLVQRVLVAR